MILASLLIALMMPVAFLFDIVPPLIPMPQPIIDALTFVMSGLSDIVHLFRYFYTPAFFNAIMLMAFVFYGFDYLYSITMWVLRKIPYLDIH